MLLLAPAPALAAEPAEPAAGAEAAASPAPGEARGAGDDLPLGPSAYGQRGLYRGWAASPWAAGRVLFNTSLEFAHASDLLVAGDTDSRVVTHLTLFGMPIEGLEVGGGFSLNMNENRAFSPHTTLTVGDPFVSVRYGYVAADWFAVGGGLQVLMPNGDGVLDLAPAGTSLKIGASFDFRPLPELLIVLNAGFHLDNSGAIFDHPLNAAQRFSAGINPSNQVLVGLGVAYQIAFAAPFVEYASEIALGAGVGFANQPHRVLVGSRFWPLPYRTLNLLAAVEIGAGGTAPPGDAYRIPPWAVTVGVGWDFGAEPALGPGGVREVVRVEKVEVPLAPDLGTVVGQVVDANTGQPVTDARIEVASGAPHVLMSDRPEGRFASCPAAPGPLKLVITAEDYRSSTQVVLVKRGAQATVTVKLQPAAGKATGVVQGTVMDVKGEPVAAKVSIPTRGIKVKADGKGRFSLKLETGTFDVLISSKGAVTQRHKIKLRPGEEVILNVELFPVR